MIGTALWPALVAHLQAGLERRRPSAQIVRQPVFVVAAAAAALGYGEMNPLMAATPTAMAQCSHPFESAAQVLEWHVLGIFVPSFFTARLIRGFGALPAMAAGAVLKFACVAAASSGVDLMKLLLTLFLPGFGWNVLYIGGKALLTTASRPEENNKAHGAMDFCVFATKAPSSSASDALITTRGWAWVNVGWQLPLAVVTALPAWLAVTRRRQLSARPDAASRPAR
ncbi:MAG TPA: hypothetical protein PL196_04905 [Burkholderiaceae bacterium]|nr:hypothetical protein [Burkholderiaceae bacterium]